MPTKQLDDQDMMILSCAAQRMTFREMAEIISRSPSVVHYRVTELQRLGLLTQPQGKARSVMLTVAGKQLIP